VLRREVLLDEVLLSEREQGIQENEMMVVRKQEMMFERRLNMTFWSRGDAISTTYGNGE
jgi:hypothetical protein